MAPSIHDPFNEFDLNDLSPRNRRIFEMGVRGGSDETPAPGAEGTPTEPTNAPAPGDAAPPEGDPAPTGDGEGAGEDENAEGRIPELPEDIENTPAEGLTDLHAQLGTMRDEIRAQERHTQADIDAIQEITRRRSAIAGEIQRRIDEDERVRQSLAQLDEEVAGETALPDRVPQMAGMQARRRPSAAEVAGARGTQAPAAQNPPATRSVARAPMLAAVGGDRVSAGNEIDIEDLGLLMDRAKRSPARTILASIPTYDESGVTIPPLTHLNGAEVNSQMMRETQDAWRASQRETDPARAAAICTPLEVLRPIPDAFNTDEPVAGIFPQRPAGRLGFTFIPSIPLASVMGATTVWDEADQADVDPDDNTTWKPCIDLDCPSPVNIVADAVPACVTFDLTTEMSNPEYVQNFTNALNAARARTKEGRILQRIDLLSHRYSYAGEGYGAVPTTVAALNTILAQLTYASRLDEESYVAILPPGLIQLLAIDMAGRGYNSDTVRDVMQYVTDQVEGVGRVVNSLDGSLGTAGLAEPSLPFDALNPVGDAADPLPSLDGVYRVRLVDPGSALYAETGALNVGVQRDTSTLRQNKVMYFAEEFILLAKNGPAPWAFVDVSLCADGSRAGLVEPYCSVS